MTKTTNMSGLARRLKHALKLGQVSARAAASLAGISSGAPGQILRGKVRGPSVSTLDPLARVLGCSLDWLVRGEGQGPSSVTVRSAVALAKDAAAGLPEAA